jgi:hypothetical protein
MGRRAPLQKRLLGGLGQSYRLALVAGQYVRIVVDQKGIDVAVKLFSPEGEELIEVDGVNENNR